MKNMKGSRALVTGGAVRIGAAICRRLALEGAGMAIHCRHSRDQAEALAGEIREAGGTAVVVQADLTDETACRNLVAEASQGLGGPLDILVNNASVFEKVPLEELTGDRILHDFWPNCFAPMLLMSAFAGPCSHGSVINLLDRRIRSNDPDCISYLASKKALEAVTLAAAVALGPAIRVNGVAPGPILPPPGKDVQYLVEKGGAMPLARRIGPEDIADAVMTLLMNESMTGQILFIDGGQHLLGNGV